jgi:hypothetical protein
MMKTRSLRLLLALGAICAMSRLSAAEGDARDFPYAIPVELGAVEFAPGDRLEIMSLRGNRPHLEIGGRYLLEGTYTLESTESGTLGWRITSRGSGTPQAVGAEETINVTRGSGSFRLIKVFQADGWPHLSFYVKNPARGVSTSAGGVYFGEAGIEQSILRSKPWSDFSTAAAPPIREKAAPRSTSEYNRANAALLAFLGNPVPPPANLELAYSAEALTAAFRAYCTDYGLRLQSIAVDESEFPFLVYGVIAQPKALRNINDALAKTRDYRYSGAVSGNTAANGTFFALNMTPPLRYPADQRDAVNRRLMLRLQMLASRVEQEPR